MVKDLKFAAAKLQTIIGTPVVVDPVTDYVQFSEFSIDHNSLREKISILSGKFTSEPSVAGNMNATIKGKVPFCSSGATTRPYCDIVLQSGGFALTEDDTPTNGSKYIYTRSISSKDFSAGEYLCDALKAIIKNASSIMINNMKLSIKSGNVPYLDFSGVGCSYGSGVGAENTAVVTYPTENKVEYYIANDVAATVLDTAYEVCGMEYEFVNKISQKPIMTGLGFGPSQVAGEETKFTASLLLDTSLAVLPLTRTRASNTPGVLNVTFGSIPGRRVSITTTKAQLETPKDATQGDLLSSDISGEVIDNEIVITFNSDIT